MPTNYPRYPLHPRFGAPAFIIPSLRSGMSTGGPRPLIEQITAPEFPVGRALKSIEKLCQLADELEETLAESAS